MFCIISMSTTVKWNGRVLVWSGELKSEAALHLFFTLIEYDSSSSEQIVFNCLMGLSCSKLEGDQIFFELKSKDC